MRVTVAVTLAHGRSCAHASPPDRRPLRPRERTEARGHARARAVAHAHAGQRRADRRARRGRVVPRGAADARRVPAQAAAAVRAGQRGRRASCAARPTAPRSRPATAWPPAACSAASPRSRWRRSSSRSSCPTQLDFAQGAGLVLNYHTAYFSLKLRGRLAEGESVLVHGAAGGVGTATLQIAKGLGARTFAVVSSDEKERIAREAGADEVVRSDGPWKDEVKELSGGGVDVDRRPGRRRSLHRQPALAARGRPDRRRRLHRRLDPGGQGQPAAAQQRRGHRRRLGRLRDGQAASSTARSAPRSSR